MFITGYDEANRADLRWHESDPENTGKQALNSFPSFSGGGGEGTGGRVLNQCKVPNSARTVLIEVSVLIRNSLPVDFLNHRVFKKNI